MGALGWEWGRGGRGGGWRRRIDARVSLRWHRFSPSSLRRLPACVCCIAAATGPPLVLPESPPPPRLRSLLEPTALGPRGQTQKTQLPVVPKMFYTSVVKPRTDGRTSLRRVHPSVCLLAQAEGGYLKIQDSRPVFITCSQDVQ